ncbi:MAG TPA: tRNA pseudouridine(55) synthase TruB [bacterium]|nr:tRNA pseudouridine(55) synthase TruB [bacterium]HPP29496.1 tRNA pseudouridine(55) synthase TruB [bacterium]
MDGIIPVNKPAGITSYDVIRFIKRTFRLKEKIGHAGTLDPLASGVLIICIGKATRMSTIFMDMEKEYEAKILLGMITDTDDIKGKVMEQREVRVSEDDVIKVIKEFEGEIEQIPPVVSAIKKKGTPLYKLHRKGIAVSPPPRKVLIKRIEIMGMPLPYVDLRVVCSKGTYIRSLCRDIGNKLGCGGTQVALKRTRVGDFKIEEAATLEAIEKNGMERYLIPVKKGVL